MLGPRWGVTPHSAHCVQRCQIFPPTSDTIRATRCAESCLMPNTQSKFNHWPSAPVQGKTYDDSNRQHAVSRTSKLGCISHYYANPGLLTTLKRQVFMQFLTDDAPAISTREAIYEVHSCSHVIQLHTQPVCRLSRPEFCRPSSHTLPLLCSSGPTRSRSSPLAQQRPRRASSTPEFERASP